MLVAQMYKFTRNSQTIHLHSVHIVWYLSHIHNKPVKIKGEKKKKDTSLKTDSRNPS